jgi:hypothetical protein
MYIAVPGLGTEILQSLASKYCVRELWRSQTSQNIPVPEWTAGLFLRRLIQPNKSNAGGVHVTKSVTNPIIASGERFMLKNNKWTAKERTLMMRLGIEELVL